ncbi:MULTISPECIES: SURF1 family protein [Rhizobium]|uniref:SURF1 family protein n=1 Tax=Rhizobium TaxID=379 RepID=UPI001B31BE04|nr:MULTISPECIES: SURF1 family protein [Rhizobium]MBX4906722.1 SURF1 family protein [Rhizobium bangladeshense]MBX5213246.1 SURF1 family protein [Rhizobium sp. NLR9a]MBX5224902.1 SURF1 family protein [Rhizobium sp. NLR9b]MBX5230764.1 SURF1 family protein [Rhizobium sp. NLR4a]MBX5237492.1 SURF1 family protein [Rhizobium sp. NLR22b]
MSEAPTQKSERQHFRAKRALFAVCLTLLAAILFGLGTWQVQRLGWKRDLIARVDQRVHDAAVPAPARADWGKVNAGSDEYRRVTVEGMLANGKETLVYASTVLGPGYWVMTPLMLADGTAILVNRGFVPTDRRDPASRRDGQISGLIEITGLMRMTEPKGSLLQSNDVAADRWYSRDVAAIAQKRGLGAVAPYFIDADAAANPGGLPVGGLTVIRFPNNHLVYAITWYGLAVMVLALLVFVVRGEIGRGRA